MFFQGSQVEERATRLELDQEVDVAPRALLPARHKAKDAHVPGPARGGGGADLGVGHSVRQP
ncbi:hypothetical protein tb265_42970 [Gemmatimonadetes bacterium T265]|nr:hypothetical protein tb265_42970 [Gemmatimonadetes bacterium T265]